MLGLVPFGQGRAGGRRRYRRQRILFGREDEAEVALLAPAEIALNGHRVLKLVTVLGIEIQMWLMLSSDLALIAQLSMIHL